MDGWTSARWKREEELAAAPRRTEDWEKVFQLVPPVLMVVVLLRAKQQQLKHPARAPKFMGYQPAKRKRPSKEKAAADAVCPQLSRVNTCGAGSHPSREQQRRWVVDVGPRLGSREVNSSSTNEIKEENAAC